MSDIVDFSSADVDDSLLEDPDTKGSYEWLIYYYRYYKLPLKAIVTDALFAHRYDTHFSFSQKLHWYSWRTWIGFCGDYCGLANDNRKFSTVCAAPIDVGPHGAPDIDSYLYPELKCSPLSFFSKKFYPRFGAIFDASIRDHMHKIGDKVISRSADA